jgi:hypothetical protein
VKTYGAHSIYFAVKLLAAAAQVVVVVVVVVVVAAAAVGMVIMTQ